VAIAIFIATAIQRNSFCCLAMLSADRNRIRFLRTGCEPDRTRHPSGSSMP
jgi:hypothetical protein